MNFKKWVKSIQATAYNGARTVLGFLSGRDFLAPRDKGTEVSSLSRDKGTMGQKSLHCFGTKGQRDKLKILSRDGLGWDFDILPQDGLGRDFDSLSHPVPGQDAGQKGKKSTQIKNFEKKKYNF